MFHHLQKLLLLRPKSRMENSCTREDGKYINFFIYFSQSSQLKFINFFNLFLTKVSSGSASLCRRKRFVKIWCNNISNWSRRCEYLNISLNYEEKKVIFKINFQIYSILQICVKKISDNSKVRICTSQLSRGKISIKRRAS